jgi:hypothetical protein
VVDMMEEWFATGAADGFMPFAAGRPGDTLARILAEHMRGSLGQSVIVENAAGIAGEMVVDHPGGGHQGRISRCVQSEFGPDTGTLTIGKTIAAFDGRSRQLRCYADLFFCCLRNSRARTIGSMRSLSASRIANFSAKLSAARWRRPVALWARISDMSGYSEHCSFI